MGNTPVMTAKFFLTKKSPERIPGTSTKQHGIKLI